MARPGREADPAFGEDAFEPAVADVLRVDPRLIDMWATWSADQRRSPSAYVQGRETGWYDSGYQNVHVHPEDPPAVLDGPIRARFGARRVRSQAEA